LQTSFSVTWKAEAEACRALGQAKERHCFAKRIYSFVFFILTLTAQNGTDDGIAEMLERVRFDRETNLC
jgi:hypothetical protein